MTNLEYDYLFRVVLVGDSGVGKTNLLLRFTKNEFNRDSHSTIGVDFLSKSFTIDSKRIKAIIWDTAGQDRFRSIATSFYRGSSAALLVYDITKYESFVNIEKWLEDVKKYGDLNMVFTLVGNKCDLEHARQVSVNVAKEYAIKNNMSFIETSALDSTNVEKAFVNIIRDVYYVYSKFKKEPDSDNSTSRSTVDPLNLRSVKLEPEPKKNQNCCTSFFE